MIKLLPHSYKIAGDIELTRLSLEKILGEQVSMRKTYSDNKGISAEKKGVNNELHLGVDSVLLSDKNEVLSPILEVTIGPISEKKINNYLKKDGVLKFINTFYDYFVPMEIEVITKITVDNEVGFLLDQEKSPIMGISTQI